ncbi:hypothetical protein C8Q80DRAFT_436642 [Daedaleopsis nitida]|nr:hypothetical protein C8Q80DRAFT_436642 [Daedaleopsis nitida]
MSPEVVEHIIDFLHTDPRALSSCALVCRVWLPRSHYHRFASVVLPVPFRGLHSALSTAFEHIVARNPDIAAYVQSLTLAGAGFLGDTVRWTHAEALKTSRLWAVRSLALSRFEFGALADLVPTLAALPLLEELALDSVRVKPAAAVAGEAPHVSVSVSGDPPRARALRLISFRQTGQPMGEGVLEDDAAAFVRALCAAGVLRPGALEGLVLLSGARACADWVPLLPKLAPSLRRCAVSLHERLSAATHELAESARGHILRVYDALVRCAELRSVCVQYNATSTLMQAVFDFDGRTRTMPAVSPFFVEALARALDGPGRALSALEDLTIVLVGSRWSLASKACADAFAQLARVLSERARYPCLGRVEVRVDEPEYVVGLFRRELGVEVQRDEDSEGAFRELLGGFDWPGVVTSVAVRTV